MHIDMQEGLPSVWMLIFTILLWLLFTAILLSDKKSRMNQWSFIAGFFFSGGVFKEYLYFGVVPLATASFPLVTLEFCTAIYSVMTALLYYLAMPSVLIVVFYFAELPQQYPRFFNVIKYVIFLPAAIFAIAFPVTQTREYQLHLPAYYLAVTVYNWLYGTAVTSLVLFTLYQKRLSHDYRQRCLITVNILLPMWYWLCSAFLVHSLRLYRYFKLWQGNILIIFFLLCYFFYHLFRDGIWGCRLYRESCGIQALHSVYNTQYVNHALKNEVTKIKWCVSGLSEQATAGQAAMLRIIYRSTQHLEGFMERTRLLSEDILLKPSAFPVYPVLSQCIQDIGITAGGGSGFELKCDESAMIYTDREHLIEMVHNLLSNALEASAPDSFVQITYSIHPVKRCAILTVTDNGSGISREARRHLFQPCYTTKGDTTLHLGLGLSYCYRVMEKQGGGIRVKSIPSKGSSFFLYFPYKKKKFLCRQGDTSDEQKR